MTYAKSAATVFQSRIQGRAVHNDGIDFRAMRIVFRIDPQLRVDQIIVILNPIGKISGFIKSCVNDAGSLCGGGTERPYSF